jgi:hypothetical protein
MAGLLIWWASYNDFVGQAQLAPVYEGSGDGDRCPHSSLTSTS